MASAVEDVLLMLDPELWCEDFRAPKNPHRPADTCPPLSGFAPPRLSFVLTGPPHVVAIAEPPIRDFVYLRASLPLAAARRQMQWLEASCDAIGIALQASLSTPVLIRASSLARMPPPVPDWFQRGGFRVERSPMG